MQYNSIDIGKFVASIAIVALHIPPIGRTHGVFSQSIDFITSLAVPYFLGMSSFLFFQKIDNKSFSTPLLLHFVKRIAILYFIWLLINSVFMSERNGEVYRSSFFIDIFLGNTFPGSWFYSALVMGISCVSFLRRINHLIMLVISLFVYLYFILSKECLWSYSLLYDWYEIHISECFLSLPYAIVWIAMGGAYSHADSRKRNLWILNSIIIIFTIICILTLSQGISVISWVLRFIIVEGLLWGTLQYEFKLKLPYKTLRKMSTLFFMIHFFFLFKFTHEYMLFGWISMKFIITLISISIISLGIILLSKRISFLKYLY